MQHTTPAPAALHSQLHSIDWSAAWWQPWRAVGMAVAQRVLDGASVAQSLNAAARTATANTETTMAQRATPTAAPAAALTATPTATQIPTQCAAQPCANYTPVEFVPHAALPEGQAYEHFIYTTRRVPTRDNLHDLLNGLAWLVFPHTKARLNALQYGELAASGVQSTRGPLRDALTLFDENAALWQAPVELVDAVRAKDWQHAFTTLRPLWRQAQPILFGHALLEKLVSPYKSITAHVFTAQAASLLIANKDWDTAIAEQLSASSLVPKPFLPLPILGVPGWWAANEAPDFYKDAQVFRPPR
jgi:hypothetical protein